MSLVLSKSWYYVKQVDADIIQLIIIPNVLIHCGLVAASDVMGFVDIASGNGLLTDGTKPFSEPVLNYRHKVFIWGGYHTKIRRYQLVEQDWKLQLLNRIPSS